MSIGASQSDSYYDVPDDEPDEIEESDPDDENERRAEYAREDNA